MSTTTASTTPEATEVKVPAIEQKYGADAVRASAKARSLTGAAGPTPKQYVAVRDALKGSDPVELIKELGISQKELGQIADGSAGRGAGRKLQPIADKVNGNAWTKGRNLAASLVALIEENKRGS